MKLLIHLEGSYEGRLKNPINIFDGSSRRFDDVNQSFGSFLCDAEDVELKWPMCVMRRLINGSFDNCS